ncbi:hypothetical protein [Legionella sp. 16cNR16C]|uniref:hypothetical protein n=1 Tax=Legionella sp. 16cNR16C TaxID=2905656 RepID=UPI001E531FDF|nr:hypothetical protein [Legionella sp. 16cNR16C]MCE3046246.1 hypothetical protein [Legionella sp. 16cNR16C]
MGKWLRRHWKLLTAVLLALLLGAAVGCLVAFFPPALPAIASFALFSGWQPFAFLFSLNMVPAAFACAAIASTAVLLFSAAANFLHWVIQSLDQLINPPDLDEVPDLTEGDYEDFYGKTKPDAYLQILKDLDFEPGSNPETAPGKSCFSRGKDNLWQSQPVTREQELLRKPLIPS